MRRNTIMFLGVDGCRAGWFTILLKKENNWEINLFRDILELWGKYKSASVILIDIPIGLPDGECKERKCDKRARQLLGSKRGRSVFRVPCRSAAYAESYEEAKCLNREVTGKKLSIQTWNIIPKILEVDMFLSANLDARSLIKESHPEICFWALAGHPMRYSKKKSEGFSERIQILQSALYFANSIVKQALSNYPRNKVTKDDILDALSLAVTAKLGIHHGFISIPEISEYDSYGLPMNIVYSLP